MADTKKIAGQEEPWFLKSNFPTRFPSHPAFTMTNEEFDAFLREDIKATSTRNEMEVDPAQQDDADTFTMVSTPPSTTAEVDETLRRLDVDEKAPKKAEDGSQHPFMRALVTHGSTPPPPDMSNKMLTENAGIANRSTTNPLVDLFSELEDVVSGPRLLELLNAAWAHDPLATLKIIFNARSIHLGKSSRHTFYRCAGWLAQYHPLTLVSNLQWLSRPVIQKKVEKKEGGDDEVVLVDPKTDEEFDEATQYDVRNGVAHGYWKDLLNLLALHVNDKLNVLAKPTDVLNVMADKETKGMKPDEAKIKRNEVRDFRHERAIQKFKTDPVYRALHLAVARLFAAQLKKDHTALLGNDPKAKRCISLCGKWTPSHKCFHDRHTFVISSIAELMHPMPNLKALLDDDSSLLEDENKKREVYLRHAREEYRKSVSALRAHLDVVERHITANTFSKIKYDRVPSVAMSNYARMFATKDSDRFGEYIDKVASGKAKISGATLLPSTLIKAARDSPRAFDATGLPKGGKVNPNKLVEQKVQNMQRQVVDGQWKTLVQRIKDSGSLESCIAVCDVSGSMGSPVFSDGTCPMDSAIGLSLLVAEVTQAPFGGAFISFSESPSVHQVDLTKSLTEKVQSMVESSWGYSTNFVAVFEKLILPMAIKNKLSQEDMVKRIFVFSDMQFNQAESGSNQWKTSYERIAEKYKEHGYEMPQLIFWNLAGGRAGFGGYYGGGDPVAPKPVTTDDVGTALVSGYSQGMLKVFLDNGSFEEEEVEEEVKDEDGDDDTVQVTKAKKQKIDPLTTVKKAISHKAYEMLQVVD